MKKFECVTFITKKDDTMSDGLLVIEKSEIYPLGKAYGGRPISDWNCPNDDEKWLLVGMVGFGFSNKRVIRETFRAMMQIGVNPSLIDKITAYRQDSDTEFERIFIWNRSDVFKLENFRWDK